MSLNAGSASFDPLLRIMKLFPSTFAVVVVFSALLGCNAQNGGYETPYATFRAHQQAIEEGDLDLLWSTYSLAFRDQQVRATWRRYWREMPSEKTRALLRREITKEEVINDQIAYLLFDPTTLENERQSPFFYFIREEGGWKITTHLDSTFHQALEKAIETGDYKLPENF
jgi:hypothetical protein